MARRGQASCHRGVTAGQRGVDGTSIACRPMETRGSEHEGGITRRRFLYQMGAAGGAAAVLSSMEVLGLAPAAGATKLRYRAPSRGDFTLQGRGNGTKVLVLGAGVAGLCAAFELAKADYDVEVLEGARAAGRTELDRPRRHDRDEPRRRDADVLVRRGPVHERRTGPHPPAPHDARVLPRARGADRGVHQRQRRRLLLQRAVVDGRRGPGRHRGAAPQGQGRHPRLRLGAARQGRQPGGAGR